MLPRIVNVNGVNEMRAFRRTGEFGDDEWDNVCGREILREVGESLKLSLGPICESRTLMGL